jgi:hypothetical protein
MLKILLLIAIVFCLGLTDAVYAQNAQQRTQELIAALGKTKYKKKEKKNISIEIYIDIKSEAVVKADPREYSGVYESGSDYRLELRVAADGSAQGSGYDSLIDSKRLAFTLRDARIEGALLTATKVFENGETIRLEAVFNNQTMISGKNPNEIEKRETSYGLGFIQSYGTWTSRLFLEFKP